MHNLLITERFLRIKGQLHHLCIKDRMNPSADKNRILFEIHTIDDSGTASEPVLYFLEPSDTRLLCHWLLNGGFPDNGFDPTRGKNGKARSMRLTREKAAERDTYHLKIDNGAGRDNPGRYTAFERKTASLSFFLEREDFKKICLQIESRMNANETAWALLHWQSAKGGRMHVE